MIGFTYRIRGLGYAVSLIILLLVSMAVISCEVSDSDGEEVREKTMEPFTEGIRIAWDYRTLTRVHDGRVFYPRIIRLRSGELLCAFESGGAVHVSRSSDEGETWSEGTEVAPPQGVVNSAVPELIQLENGDVLLAYNARPPQDNSDPNNRFGIKLRVSGDGGVTWSDQQNVFEGGYRWSRGVWEPAMIQLPSGEVQLFFANEFPYANSNDQEISMVRSPDGGQSWSEPETISYRAGHRDGMPVPLILHNGGTAVAVEDNGIDSGEFKPVVIWRPADEDRPQTVTGDSDRRWRALKDEEQLPATRYGGAPYLKQLESGKTLLSFQSNEKRQGPWSNSAMTVAIGDEQAKNFSRKSLPFQVPQNRSALWNSLFIKSDTSVSAVTSTTAFDASRSELYVKDGYIVDEPRAPYGSIEVDGIPDEETWNRSPGGFIGAYSPANVTVFTAWDEENFYVYISANDEGRDESPDLSVAERGGVTVALAPGLLSGDKPVSGTYKILASPSGETVAFRGSGGGWTSHEIETEIAAGTNSAGEPGYRMEIAIPWTEIGGRPGEQQGWGINFELRTRTAANRLHTETVSGNRKDRPSTWSRIELIR